MRNATGLQNMKFTNYSRKQGKIHVDVSSAEEHKLVHILAQKTLLIQDENRTYLSKLATMHCTHVCRLIPKKYQSQ